MSEIVSNSSIPSNELVTTPFFITADMKLWNCTLTSCDVVVFV